MSTAFLQREKMSFYVDNDRMIDKRDATAEERLAIFEWFQYLTIKYGTAKSVAEKSGIAPTTITRFVKHWRTAAIPSTTTIRMIENGTGEIFSSGEPDSDIPINQFERNALGILRDISPDDHDAVLATIRAFARNAQR